jgi:hypothetical protein
VQLDGELRVDDLALDPDMRVEGSGEFLAMWNERFGEYIRAFSERMDRFMAKASRSDTPEESGSYEVMIFVFFQGPFGSFVLLPPQETSAL